MINELDTLLNWHSSELEKSKMYFPSTIGFHDNLEHNEISHQCYKVDGDFVLK